MDVGLGRIVSEDREVNVSAYQEDTRSSLLALLYALAIAGYPVVSGLALLLHLETRTSSIAYRGVVVLLTLVAMLRWMLFRRKIYLGKILIPLYLLWGLMIYRMAWDSWVISLSSPWKNWDELFIFTVGVGMIPATAFLERATPSTLSSARKYIEVLGVLGLTLVASLASERFTPNAAYWRLSTETFNPIAVGHLALSVFIVAATGITARESGVQQRRLSRVSFVARLLILAFSLLVLVSAASKGPIVAGCIALLLLMYVRPYKEGKRGVQFLSQAALLALVLLLGYGTMLILESQTSLRPLERITESGEDESTTGRVLVMQSALSQFLASPVLGSAVYEQRTGMYPHNILIESLMATGVVGFVLLMSVIVACSRAAWRLIHTRHPAKWVGLLYFQYLTAAMFSTSLFESTQLWAMSVAVIAAQCPFPSNTSCMSNGGAVDGAEFSIVHAKLNRTSC